MLYKNVTHIAYNWFITNIVVILFDYNLYYIVKLFNLYSTETINKFIKFNNSEKNIGIKW